MLLESGNWCAGFGVEYLGIINLRMIGLIPGIAISGEGRSGLINNCLPLLHCENGFYFVLF